MFNKKEVTLDEILTRKRRADASKIASEILGKKRSQAVPINKGRADSTPSSPSSGSGALAGSGHGKWKHDLHHRVNPAASRVSKSNLGIDPSVARSLRNNRLFEALHGGPVATTTTTASSSSPSTLTTTAAATTATSAKGGGPQIRGMASSTSSAGFQIRGSAAPAVVQASNFAPGTTAEDIRHAMASIGKILSCIILTASPSVISEIVFEKRDAAAACIRQYNGQRADGRLLQVFFKNSPPVGPVVGAVKLEQQEPPQYKDPYQEREEADRRRREQNIHFQDGRYGMKPPPIYSDALLQKGRGFNY